MSNRASVKRNILYTIITQTIVVAIGLIKTLVLPNAFKSVDDYGFWQVYLFYTSYLLIFTFGFHEGVYLEYGGMKFDELPDKKLTQSFVFHIFLMLAITIIATILLFFLTDNISYKRYVYFMVIIKLIPSSIGECFSRLFQATNEFKKYSIFTIIDKIVFLAFLLVALVCKLKEYKIFIFADVVIQCIINIIIFIKYIRFYREKICTNNISIGYNKWLSLVKPGLKIILCNYVAILATGYGRFLVEQFGNITEYAYYSLGVSVLNFVLLGIGTFSIVLYPSLKTIDSKLYKEYYTEFTCLFSVIIPLLLIMYFPLVYIIEHVLTKYIPAIRYLTPLLGITVVKGTIDICITPFMKASRKEKEMLKTSLIGLGINIIVSTPIYLITKEVISVAYASFVMMIIEYLYQSHILHKEYSTQNSKHELINVAMIVVWIVCNQLTRSIISLSLGLLFFFVFFTIHFTIVKKYVLNWNKK